MVNIGLVVEGHSEKIFVESDNFIDFCNSLNINIVDTYNASGNGNLCSTNIKPLLDNLKAKHTNIDITLVLADLDPEICAPCITRRKERIGNHADYIVIARNAIEAWFLADNELLSNLFGTSISNQISINCEQCENPFGKLKELNTTYNGRGLRNKKQFIRRNIENLDLYRAAENSASAQYLINTLNQISQL